jgi:hypothetical protein
MFAQLPACFLIAIEINYCHLRIDLIKKYLVYLSMENWVNVGKVEVERFIGATSNPRIPGVFYIHSSGGINYVAIS